MPGIPLPEPKSPLASKTIWFNLIALLLSFLLSGNAQPVMGDGSAFAIDQSLLTAIIVAIANIVLRFLTKSPLSVVRKGGSNDDDDDPDDGYVDDDSNFGIRFTLSYSEVNRREPPANDTVPATPNDLIPTLPSVAAAACLLLLLTSGIAEAAAPKAVLRGPTSIEVGDIVVFSGADSANEPTHFDWEVTPTLANRVQLVSMDGKALSDQDSERVQVAPIPGEYLIRLTVSNADGSSTTFQRIKIPGVAPGPVPGPFPQPAPTPAPLPAPNPAPTPPAPGPFPAPSPAPAPPQPPQPVEPTFPNSPFGLAMPAYKAAKSVNSPNRQAEAACLVKACETLAAEIAAGTLKQPQAIANRIGESIDQCSPPAWDAARNQIAEAIQKLFLDGKLRQPDDWRTLLIDLQQGLAAAAK